MAIKTPQPGVVLAGKYRLLRMLGQGGMGTVFEAEHALTGKRVALKWMHIDSSGDPEATQRFVREARATARLRHPNVVDVYDVECMEEEAFLVMELLEGEPLSALLARGDTTLPTLIDLLLPVMGAVEKAHESGVIHRDIKPDNIFLCRQEGQATPVPKVLDFGISKVAGAETLSMTRAGAAMGTPQYMSLEQLYGQADIDGRTDIYAFGVMLYEAATGQLPYDAEAITELAVKVATTEPPHPRSLQPHLPEALCEVILRAMAKKRDDRYADLGSVIQALQPFSSTEALPAMRRTPPATVALAKDDARMADDNTVMAMPTTTTVRVLQTNRQRYALVGGVIAALLLAGVFVALEQSASNASDTVDAVPTPTESAPEAKRDHPQSTAVAATSEPLPEGLVPPATKNFIHADKPRPQRSLDVKSPSVKTGATQPATAAPSATVGVASAQTAQAAKQSSATAPSSINQVPKAAVLRPTSTSAPVTAPLSILSPRSSPLAAGAQPLPSRSAIGSSTTVTPTAPKSVPQHATASTTPAIATPASLPYRNVAALKNAYRAQQITRAEYNTQARALKVWRKQAIHQAKVDYKQQRIDRAAYDKRVDAINHAYKGG